MKKFLQLSLLSLACLSLTSCSILRSILHVPAYFLQRIVEVEDTNPALEGPNGYQTIEVATELSEVVEGSPVSQ